MPEYRIVAWIDGVLYAVKPIVHVRRVAAVVLAAASLSANAAGPAHGGIGAAAHGGNPSSHGQSAQGQSGQGDTGECDMAHYVLCEQSARSKEK